MARKKVKYIRAPKSYRGFGRRRHRRHLRQQRMFHDPMRAFGRRRRHRYGHHGGGRDAAHLASRAGEAAMEGRCVEALRMLTQAAEKSCGKPSEGMLFTARNKIAHACFRKRM